MVPSIWRVERGAGPLVATAIHDGHSVREEVAEHLALDEATRLREEDPFTGAWTAVATTRIIGSRSRFEVDLNRSRERAVYQTAEDAWGLRVWDGDLPNDLVARSLAEYDAFYAMARTLLTEVERNYGSFVVLDLHSYNHRRGGPDAPPASEHDNPQVNVGTGTMDRVRWARVVDRLMADLHTYDFPLGRLDVRENVKFRGGHFSRWVHETFPKTGCALAIEFKKFFMDEWTGTADSAIVRGVTDALHSTVPGLLEELNRL